MQQTHKKAEGFWQKYPKQDVLTAFFFLLPVFAVFFVFKYYPLVDSLKISFHSWNLYNPMRYTGLQNYERMFENSTFWKVLFNTFQYTFWSTALSVVIGLFLALSLYRMTGLMGRSLKTLFFIPNITTASAVAILWIWIFNPVNGLTEIVYSAFGLTSPAWLLDKNLAMWTVIMLGTWRSMGYAMTIYISGMAQISDDVYEAASIDGASRAQQAVFITIPLLRDTTVFLTTTMFIQAMQVFDTVQVMTEGGPSDATNVMNLYIYQEAFVRTKAGSAAALSMVLFMILLVCTVIQRRVTREKGGI